MRLGKFGYHADFFACFLCVAALCGLEITNGSTWFGWVEWLTGIMIGAGLWTLLEYGIHRWLYHGVPFFIRLHDAHHNEPHIYIGAPPFIGIVLIFLVIYLPVMSIKPMDANGLTIGTLLGYLGYQLVHHATHFWQPARGRYLYRARLYHSVHHHHRELGNFGITTAFWDQVFGTSIEVKRNLVGAKVSAEDV